MSAREPARRIGLLYRPGRGDAEGLSEALERAFRERGATTWRGPVTDGDALCDVASGLDLLVTLGGDGTIVRAVHCVAPIGVPILGVNLGRLGFMAEVEPSDALEVIPRVLEGEYWLEERMMLHAELHRGADVVLSEDAINDVVLGRGRGARSVRIAVDVDGHYVMTQTADGIIVSSPTGSTAYCLSAGGPIITPGTRCIALTPIAAHLAVAHSIVIPSDASAQLTLTKGRDAVVTVDGQLDVGVRLGDRLCVTQSRTTAKFVRLAGQGHYYETVLRRLRWPDQADDPEEPAGEPSDEGWVCDAR